MDNFILLLITVISCFCFVSNINCQLPPGKYHRRENEKGKYRHSPEGEYVPTDKWKYVHYDDGDRGRYIHIDVPYDGGYGNYEGGHEKYRTPAYDPTGEYSHEKYQKSYDPCRSSPNDRNSVYLEYGEPGEGKNQCFCSCKTTYSAKEPKRMLSAPSSTAAPYVNVVPLAATPPSEANSSPTYLPPSTTAETSSPSPPSPKTVEEDQSVEQTSSDVDGQTLRKKRFTV